MGSEYAEEIDLDTEEVTTQAEDRGDDVAPGMGPDLDDDDETPPEDDEGEEHQDGDADAQAEEPADDEPQGQPENAGYIPKPRFNEVNQALKAERAARIALEEEIARLKAGEQSAAPQDAPADTFDFIEADRRYRSAIYDGDDEAADAIRAEIREAERKEAIRLAEERAAELVRASRAAEVEAATRAAVNAVTAEAYERFPFLDNESDAADADAIAMVIAVRNRHIEAGLSPAEALSMAVDKVGPMFGTDAAPRQTKPTRTAQQMLDKANSRAARIPPRPDGVGERVRSLDVAAMSEREFSALSDEDKRRARGDFVG